MRFLLIRLHYGKSSFTWAEIGTMLKECWWMVALFFVLFIPRAYLLHREHKLQMEEREEQERMRERYGEPLVKEKKPPYEDTYLDTPRSQRIPDGETPFGAPDYMRPRYEWRMMCSLLTIGFIVGMGSGFDGASNVLMLLMIIALIGVVIVFRHLGPDWMYTAFDKDREKKLIGWKRLGKELLPYGVALAIGLVLGFLRLLLMG